MQTLQRINDAREVAGSLSSWDDYSFDWGKAYVASVFCKIAYLKIPEYEIKNADRANLIPCQEYRVAMATGSTSTFQQLLQQVDFQQVFVVQRPYVVVVIFKVAGVVFISMRGTQALYDWLVNLDARSKAVFPSYVGSLRVHAGFHRAVVSCLNEVIDTVYDRLGDDATLYFTGHSLGGALAALLHAYWRTHRYEWSRIRGRKWRQGMDAHSCYTFGMPRYGNLDSIFNLAQPFHVYNEMDIVPTVPPRFFGYSDCAQEYCLSQDKRLVAAHRKGSSFTSFVVALATMRLIRDHDMEVYMDRAESAYRNGVGS